MKAEQWRFLRDTAAGWAGIGPMSDDVLLCTDIELEESNRFIDSLPRHRRAANFLETTRCFAMFAHLMMVATEDS